MSWHTKGGHDTWTLLGIGVVAVAAAVLSFASLQQLGQRAGYGPELAALLPVAIDAQAVVATRAWLATSTPAAARRYARALALASVGLSVIGNAGQHAMAAAETVTPWWVVVLISAVPPVALAATAHLAALLATRPVEPTASTLRVEESATTVHPAPAESSPDPADPIEATDSTAELRESTPTRRKRSRSTRSTTAPAGRSLEQLRTEFAAAVESGRVDPTSAESIRKTLRVGAARARQLRDEHDRPRLAVVGEHQ